MRAHFIDVGQADATLLEFPCGAILVDAGSQDDTFTDHLASYIDGILQQRQAQDSSYSLASVIATHNHIDHTRALRRVVEDFSPGIYVDTGQSSGSGTGWSYPASVDT